MAAKQTHMIKGDVVGHKSYGFSQTIDAKITKSHSSVTASSGKNPRNLSKLCLNLRKRAFTCFIKCSSLTWSLYSLLNDDSLTLFNVLA